MAVTINDPVRDAAVTASGAEFNSGFVRVYGGDVPANAGAALGGATLLAEVSVEATAFGAASAGQIAMAGVPLSDNDINASGEASFFRLVNGAATSVLQGTVGEAASDMIVDNTSFVQGGIFTINSFTITMPAG